MDRLKSGLEKIYQTYRRDYLLTDPVWFVHQYSNPLDQELVAFLAASFAYGKVDSIFKFLRELFGLLGRSPSQFLINHSEKIMKMFDHLYYRFHRTEEIRSLLWLLSEVYRQEGSLESSFKKFLPEEKNGSKSCSLFSVLNQWTLAMKKNGKEKLSLSGIDFHEPAMNFFFSSPEGGSSCKRLNLFLRWMVREKDGIDLGLWKIFSPSQLVIPLDTHIFRISKLIDLTDRSSPGWKTAEEITLRLSCCDPNDPTKYDFALTRLGMLGISPIQALNL